jgi:hypothetical protein
MIAPHEAFEVLMSRVDALEKRVRELEHPSEAFAAPDVPLPVFPAIALTNEESGVERASRAFPVIGRAMLGIAGAYVLRAVAESSPIPRRAIAGVAIAYAVAWLVWAARTTDAQRFTRAIYAGTAILILAPMLWELTLRFKVLSPAVTAGVLAGFVVLATALAWKQNLAQIFWVVNGAAALTAIVLSIATLQVAPFVSALLLMVLICECAAALGREQSVPPLVLTVADAAILAQIFIYSGPESARPGYPVLGVATLLAPACMLFLIQAANVTFKTVFLQRRITVFETVQSMIAFLLATSSVLIFEPKIGAVILGVACLILSAGCFGVAFGLFRHITEQRNSRVFAVWSLGLFVGGALWSLPSTWAAAFLGLAALPAIVFGGRLGCRSLDLHGVVFLSAAAAASGLPGYVFRALAGTMPARPGWSVFIVSVCAASCYGVGKERRGEGWQDQLLHLAPAFLAACAIAALIAQAMLQLSALVMVPDVFHVAFIRTLTICAVALALAFGGARWMRLEMTRIAYAALAFVAAKLMFEDLRLGRMEFIAGSFFLFAVTLIAVPRLARAGDKT